jgi:serine phosphatase RsbU (regulator of sigma subunit)
MTMAFVVLDLATGDGALISAAHVPMMVARGTKVEGLMSPGPLLGMGHSPRYVSKRFKLDLGDRIFLFTDGLTQNRGPQGRSLKIVQLKEILSQYPDPGKASQKIITEASSIWLGEAPEDDCTYLILRWNEKVARQGVDESIPITKKIRSA